MTQATPADAMQAMAQPIRFFHRGQIVEVHGAAGTRSVLDWLREDARCTGTKEGCNEGDCGACTVVVGELPEQADPGLTPVRGLSLRTVNACIQFLPTLHGKALFSVADLQQGELLHPAQQALVECHGSQCGFCTPGFVMSMWASCEQHQAAGERPSRSLLADELSGNLCRCTGYRPILDAAERMFELPPQATDFAPAVAALQAMAQGPALDVRDPSGARFVAPRRLDELARVLEAAPQSRVLAGSTDVGLWVTKQFRALGDIVYLGEVAELKRIEEVDGVLDIGAGASLQSAWRALAQRHPELAEMGLRFAAPPVRQAGTLGGNVANGSPIGDSPAVLMALQARLRLRLGARTRELALEDFYLGYMKNALEPGEFVERILVPPPAAGLALRAYKVSKRFDCDISALSAGLALELEGDRVRAARLAFGGMAAVVKRAGQAEAALIGRAWDEAALRDAQLALQHDFTPLSDMRASAEHRRRVAANLLRRLWLETRPQGALPSSLTRVFPVRAMN
ncbi:MAG: xanthine dehydrogenase small subunit [Curvibacter sp.]|nr:xanthine dehydrogenase small subunit [Curvibacter sp.]